MNHDLQHLRQFRRRAPSSSSSRSCSRPPIARRSWSDTQERFPELAETFRKLAEAMAMLQATQLRQPCESSAWQDEAPHPERFGPYRVIRSIGRGGMGEVYEAVEEPLGRHVAIKTLRRHATSESLLLRFDRERRTLARLHHTNVVPIYATGSEGDLLYFAMPYLAGASLGQVIKTARSHELSGNGLSSSSFEDLVHEAHSKTPIRLGPAGSPGSAAPGSPASDAASSHRSLLRYPSSLEGLHPDRGPGDGHGGRGPASRP